MSERGIQKTVTMPPEMERQILRLAAIESRNFSQQCVWLLKSALRRVEDGEGVDAA